MNTRALFSAGLLLLVVGAATAGPVVFPENWESHTPGGPPGAPWYPDPHMAGGSLPIIAGPDYNHTPLGNQAFLVNYAGLNGRDSGNQARLAGNGRLVQATDANRLLVSIYAKGAVTKRSEWYLEVSLGDVHAPRLADVGVGNPLPQAIPVIAYCKPFLDPALQHKSQFFFDGRVWIAYGALDYDLVWQNMWFRIDSDSVYIMPGSNNNPADVPRQYPGDFDRISIYTRDANYSDYTVLDDLSITGGNIRDMLEIAPGDSLVSIGPVGGPFSPECKAYTLTNITPWPTDWSAAGTQSWLDVSPASGTLSPGGSVNVGVCINANANALPLGIFTDQVTFSDLTNNAAHTRGVELHAGPIDAFTQPLTSDNAPDHVSVMFMPDASPHGYHACSSPASAFPTVPSGGSDLNPGDNGSVKVTLERGAQVSLYGTAYSEFYVGSNGYITFGSGDTVADGTLASHFSRRRVSGLFADLAPAAGQVRWKQLMDRAAVTYENVAQAGVPGTNSFQIEMFYDGRIRMTWLGLAATSGVAGLSRGNGVPVDFVVSDLSAYASCPPSLHAPDFDDDGDVDAADANMLINCMSGPDIEPVAGCQPPDLDLDADIDQSDFAIFQRCLSGTDVPADPACIE